MLEYTQITIGHNPDHPDQPNYGVWVTLAQPMKDVEMRKRLASVISDELWRWVNLIKMNCADSMYDYTSETVVGGYIDPYHDQEIDESKLTVLRGMIELVMAADPHVEKPFPQPQHINDCIDWIKCHVETIQSDMDAVYYGPDDQLPPMLSLVRSGLRELKKAAELKKIDKDFSIEDHRAQVRGLMSTSPDKGSKRVRSSAD